VKDACGLPGGGAAIRWGVVLALAGAAAVGSARAAQAFSASFSWAGMPACASTSPAFAIRGAPDGTAKLAFEMRDLDAPGFHHGGATVAYDGRGEVARGAIAYVGPCPPSGQVHRYIWTVQALAADGKVLAKTTAEGRFPAK
jgi:phosphatidylethanolamine-binding protein (PEBP) family uncharacterized protein